MKSVQEANLPAGLMGFNPLVPLPSSLRLTRADSFYRILGIMHSSHRSIARSASRIFVLWLATNVVRVDQRRKGSSRVLPTSSRKESTWSNFTKNKDPGIHSIHSTPLIFIALFEVAKPNIWHRNVFSSASRSKCQRTHQLSVSTVAVSVYFSDFCFRGRRWYQTATDLVLLHLATMPAMNSLSTRHSLDICFAAWFRLIALFCLAWTLEIQPRLCKAVPH